MRSRPEGFALERFAIGKTNHKYILWQFTQTEGANTTLLGSSIAAILFVLQGLLKAGRERMSWFYSHRFIQLVQILLEVNG